MFEIPREYTLTAESKISTVIQMNILKQINTAKTLKIQKHFHHLYCYHKFTKADNFNSYFVTKQFIVI